MFRSNTLWYENYVFVYCTNYTFPRVNNWLIFIFLIFLIINPEIRPKSSSNVYLFLYKYVRCFICQLINQMFNKNWFNLLWVLAVRHTQNISCFFCVIPKEFLPASKLQSFSTMSSFRKFVVLSFLFRFVIHFELIYEYNMR